MDSNEDGVERRGVYRLFRSGYASLAWRLDTEFESSNDFTCHI
jgi:hypothetical protein